MYVRTYLKYMYMHVYCSPKKSLRIKKCETSAVSHGVISNRSVIRLVFGSSSSELSRSVNIRLITCTKVLSTCTNQVSLDF